MLAMTFCMGLSSTLFSPALNGSIPELFPVGQVPRINALFKLGTTASILFGVFLAGIALDQAWIETAYPFGRWLVAILAVTVAAGGLVSTAFIPAYPFPMVGGHRFLPLSAHSPQGWPAAPCHLGGSVLLFPLDPAVARDQ